MVVETERSSRSIHRSIAAVCLCLLTLKSKEFHYSFGHLLVPAKEMPPNCKERKRWVNSRRVARRYNQKVWK
jgi:hypothetical protein